MKKIFSKIHFATYSVADDYKIRALTEEKNGHHVMACAYRGFYHHASAVSNSTVEEMPEKIRQYALAAQMFENAAGLEKHPIFNAYAQQYRGYEHVVRAGIAQQNKEKADLYGKSSEFFRKASLLFRTAASAKEQKLSYAWSLLTKACALDARAAAMMTEYQKISCYRNCKKTALHAHSLFSKLKVRKLRERSESLEFSSSAWLLAYKGLYAKASKIFDRAASTIKKQAEWELLVLFLRGWSKWFAATSIKGQEKNSLIRRKKLFVEAAGFFAQSKCPELEKVALRQAG
ncbi:MAG: hypothetical protein WC613_03810 [Candidatus Aenigmatarchaeota archaeon]